MLRPVTLIAMALVVFGCSSESGTSGSTSPTPASSNSSGPAPGASASNGGDTAVTTGTCTVSGAITGTVKVNATCNNLKPGGNAWALSLSSHPANANPNTGGNFGFPEQPVAGKAYTLHEATAVVGFGSFLSWNGDGEVWMAGSISKVDPSTGSISIKVDDCSPVAHGSLTATMIPTIKASTGEATMTCTF